MVTVRERFRRELSATTGSTAPRLRQGTACFDRFGHDHFQSTAAQLPAPRDPVIVLGFAPKWNRRTNSSLVLPPNREDRNHLSGAS